MMRKRISSNSGRENRPIKYFEMLSEQTAFNIAYPKGKDKSWGTGWREEGDVCDQAVRTSLLGRGSYS